MAIVSGEYKSVIGLDRIYFALVTADDATAYTGGTPEWLAPAATAKVSTTSSSTAQYADDGVFDSSSSEGESVVDIEVTNVPLITAAKLLGKTFNATNGMMVDGSSANPPDCALSFRSKKSNGKYKYIQYLKGKFSMSEEEFATLEASPAPKTAKLKYTAFNTIHPFQTAVGKTETVRRVTVDEDQAASATVIANWFTAVQVPPTVTA
jgi:phi13 family phage major tail protein